MASHGDFTWGNGPDVQVVDSNVLLSVAIHEGLSEFFDVDSFWNTFHHNFDACLDDWNGGEHDDDGEEVSAEWVEPPQIWEEVDDKGSDNDSNTHQHISKDVKECSINKHTTFIVVVVIMVTVTVVMSVVCVALLIIMMVVVSLVSLFVLKKLFLNILIEFLCCAMGMAVIVTVVVTMTVTVIVPMSMSVVMIVIMLSS